MIILQEATHPLRSHVGRKCKCIKTTKTQTTYLWGAEQEIPVSKANRVAKNTENNSKRYEFSSLINRNKCQHKTPYRVECIHCGTPSLKCFSTEYKNKGVFIGLV